MIKLHGCIDSPPTLAVRLCLEALKLPYEFINILFEKGEHMTDVFAKMNPQKEVPVIEDDGFYLSESIAILQYLCDKYAPESPLYPKNPSNRAIVNHRLCFNSMFYYSSIGAYTLMPIYFDYERSPMGLKKVNISLTTFETYLRRAGTKYAAGDNLTIGDISLIPTTLCLEAIDFNLDKYPLIKKWYATFKAENPVLWKKAEPTLKMFLQYEENPPDLSSLQHPIYPTRKVNK